MKPFYFIALALGCGLGVQAQTNTNAAASGTNAAGQILAPMTTNAPAEPKPPRGPTVIEADGPADFDLTAREVIYHDHVRVDDPEMKLTCERLTANLPEAGERMTNIVAETNVVIDFSDEKGRPVHATGDKAIYCFRVQDGVTNETVTLSGNPQVENALGTQTGDEIVWDRANNRITIPRNARMVFHQNLNSAMSGTNPPPATSPPAKVTNSPPATHRAAADTNSAPGKPDSIQNLNPAPGKL